MRARLMLRPHCAGVLAIVAICGCAGSASLPDTGTSDGDSTPLTTPLRFADRTNQSGIDFAYRNGEEAGIYSIVESLGGGLALLDYDCDGRLDLFVAGGGRFGPGKTMHGRPPGLFRHEDDWHFRDVTAAARAGVAPFYSHGPAVADYNNDGFADVLLTGYGGLVLFANQGDGTFVECAAPAGLTKRSWSSSAAWGDVNGDGCLDLYVASYVNWSWDNHPRCTSKGKPDVCSPIRYDALDDVLYLGTGDGRFRDATKTAGLKPGGKGLGVLMADVDLDGRLDVYVANDLTPNFLYHNRGDGRLHERGMESGTALSADGDTDGSMGVDLGDFNLDGLPDLWVANYERQSFALYRNDGGCTFTHASQFCGVSLFKGLYVGWGTAFADFDRDGDEDLFVTNGHAMRTPRHSPVRQKPLLLENRNGKRLVNVAALASDYTAADHMGRGLAVGDVDEDGDLDVAVSHTNEPVTLLSNESQVDGGWLSLRLIGTRSSRDPVGALVWLETTAGTQIRQVKNGGSYSSSNDPRLFFGLGKARVQRARIRWPSGREQAMPLDGRNRRLIVIEGRPALPN